MSLPLLMTLLTPLLRGGAALRPVPAVTNSLLNMGKLDIAFYINAKPQDFKAAAPQEESCACAGAGLSRGSSGSPADILARLLNNKDLFSSRSALSPLCCGSHEQMREDSLLLEWGPQPAANTLPALLRALAPRSEPRAHPHLELVVLPDRATQQRSHKKKVIAKEGIRAVGERSDYKSVKLLSPPARPSPSSSSVKKDLTGQGQGDFKPVVAANLV